MGHRLAIAIVIALSCFAQPAPAVPCRVGFPCRGHRPPPPPPRPTIYVRTSRGVLPSFSYSRVLGFLTAAPWEQIATTGGYGGTGYGGTGYGGAAPAGPRIRFVTTIKRGAKSADRLVPVRRIVRRAGVTMIELDGAVFTLDRCTIDAYRASECLTLRTDLTFDDPEPEQETQQHFARPPGAS